jgi:Metallo-peptidase family M12/S-layer homology domain
MTKTHRSGLVLVLGLVALAAAEAAGAATIRSPYASSASPAAAARLAADGQEGLDLDAVAAAALMGRTDQILEIQAFPIAPGTTKTLRLHRFEVAAPGARITVQGPNGETSLPMPSVTHFSGIVEGEPDSSVYIGATPERLVAYIHSSLGHAYVGPDETERGFVVRMAESPLNASAASVSWRCRSEELPAALTAKAEPSHPAPGLPDVAFKQATVRVETDNQLYTRFSGNVANLSTYVLTLFGADNVIYNRDLSLYLVITEIHVWSVADPYTGSDTLTQLDQLGDWWHVNKPLASNPRTLVHYLSGHPVAGGIAWVGVLCDGDFSTGSDWGGAYSLTQVFATYPLQLWDQDSSAHEMGHNVGSPHTHCMGPGTAYPYPTWTDECYNGESGCYSGTVQNPGIGGGTIMSYCHLLGWQYMSLVFHPRCINDIMLPAIAGASCLTTPVIFADILPSDPFLSYIDTVYTDGITSGCGTNPLIYCSLNSVTRAQMAVFLLKAVHGSSYTPPACTGVFSDVPCSSSFAPWIEELASEGITSGCGAGIYCPSNPVTRQQMAAFLLKAEHGSAYTPPACTSNPFTDVACPSQFANWIKQLVTEGVTGGCGSGDYCPANPVTRGQMAVFLVKTFGL